MSRSAWRGSCIVREGVQILTGGQWTPNVSAIAPLATEAGIPYVVMSSGTASTTRLSPFLVRVAFTTWQHSYHMGKWAAMNGLTRASTIVSDYAAGVDAEDAFVRGFKDGGGTIVSSVRAPLRTADYVPFLERIRRDKPQALYGFNPGGPEATRFIKAYDDLGLAVGGHPAHRTECDRARRRAEEHGRCGDRRDLGVALFGGRRSAGQPHVRQRVEEGVRRRTAVPNYFAVGGWDGMAAIVDAIRAQNGELDARADAGTSDELEQPRQPSRPDANRSGDPRRHPQHLHPPGPEGGRRAAER